MPFWDDADFQGYESGGVTGGAPLGYSIQDVVPGGEAAPSGDAPPAAAFDPLGQVGHNDTFNGMTREQYRDAWLNSGVKDIAGAKAWMAQHGGQILADNGTARTPYGETMDLLFAAKTGNGHPQWGGGPGTGGPGDGASMPTSLSSYAAPAPMSTAGQAGHLTGRFDPFVYEKFDKPADFVAPTGDSVQQDPGYAFGRDQGLQAMTNSASARGLLRSGGTLKDFAQFGNDYATTKYGDAYNRALNTYNTNTGNAFNTNQANNQGRLAGFTANTNADLGYGNLDLGYTRAGNDYALGQGQLALGNKQADQGYALGQGNLGLGYGRLDLDRQGQTFNQGYSLADLGLRASGQLGAYGSQYANNAGNYATGAGNATAAGQVGSANAWGSGLTGAANSALGAYGMYKYYN